MFEVFACKSFELRRSRRRIVPKTAIEIAQFFQRVSEDRGIALDKLHTENLRLKEELENTQAELDNAYEEMSWMNRD